MTVMYFSYNGTRDWLKIEWRDQSCRKHEVVAKARFKRRILHAPNLIAELSAFKIRRLNQLNATYFN